MPVLAPMAWVTECCSILPQGSVAGYSASRAISSRLSPVRQRQDRIEKIDEEVRMLSEDFLKCDVVFRVEVPHGSKITKVGFGKNQMTLGFFHDRFVNCVLKLESDPQSVFI